MKTAKKSFHWYADILQSKREQWEYFHPHENQDCIFAFYHFCNSIQSVALKAKHYTKKFSDICKTCLKGDIVGAFISKFSVKLMLSHA